MWEKIKKFFKWIADHTGISWIARKISSGWKWLFGGKANATQQNTSQQGRPSGNERQETHSQSKDNTLPKTPSGETILGTPNQSTLPEQHASSNKPNVAQQNTKPESYLEFTDNKLLFITTNENYEFLEAKCKNEDQEGKVIPEEFRVFVKCKGENFCITCSYSSQQDVGNTKKSVSITSVRKQNAQSSESSDPVEMMYKVGLDEDRKLVEITQIFIKPFKTAMLEQPNPNGTSHNVTQQVVNNDSNETEVKQASGSTTTGLTEQLPEINSTQELSTPNNEPVKIDTPDQPKSPAVPNESRETLVNAHEKKGEPNNAASNGEVQPEVSNKEVAAEEHASSSTTAGQQSDLNAGTKEIDNLQASADDSTLNSDSSSFEVINGLTLPTSPEQNGKSQSSEEPATNLLLDSVQPSQQPFPSNNEKNGQPVGKS